MHSRKIMRKSRQRRIRAVVRGTSVRPRLAVYRSGTAMYAQLIDDVAGITLVSARSIGKNIAAGVSMGSEIALAAGKKKITAVVFDRGGNRYHGVIKAFAQSAREGGLKF